VASGAIVGSLVGFGVTGDTIGVGTLSSETAEEGSEVEYEIGTGAEHSPRVYE